MPSSCAIGYPGAISLETTDGHDRTTLIRWDFDMAHGAIDASPGSLASRMRCLISSSYCGILGGVSGK